MDIIPIFIHKSKILFLRVTFVIIEVRERSPPLKIKAREQLPP